VKELVTRELRPDLLFPGKALKLFSTENAYYVPSMGAVLTTAGQAFATPVSSLPTALCAEDDVWYKPYTDINVKPEAVQGYFDWEFGLVERIKKDGDVRFDLTPR